MCSGALLYLVHKNEVLWSCVFEPLHWLETFYKFMKFVVWRIKVVHGNMTCLFGWCCGDLDLQYASINQDKKMLGCSSS